MSDENKAVARRFFEVFSSGDVDALDDTVAEDAIDHDAYNPYASEGREGAKKVITMYREAFPDLVMQVDEQIAEGDMVATRWHAEGTHEGDLMGFAGTGNRATTHGIAIDRVQDGKVVEAWVQWDVMHLMQVIGAVPAPEAAAAS
jgi:steroid delta-isomerase-like uncharacterized protein